MPSLVLHARTRAKAMLAVFAAVAMCSLGAFAGRPSRADASLSQCNGGEVGWFCLWQNSGFSGTIWLWNAGVAPTSTWFYVGAAANDKASSLDNFRVRRSFVGENADWKTDGGGHACILAGQNYRDLNQSTNVGPYLWSQNLHSANDSISGILLDTTYQKCDGQPTLVNGVQEESTTQTTSTLQSSATETQAPLTVLPTVTK